MNNSERQARGLPADDLELLQAALLELHELRDLEGLRAIAGPLFRRVIPADYFAWFGSPSGRLADLARDGLLWESPPRATRAVLSRFVEMEAQHPFVAHIRRTGDFGPLRLSDFWTRREQLGSELYQKAMRPLGIGRLLGMPVGYGDRAGTLSLARPLAAPDFSERDRTMLRLLAPHFTQALRIAEVSTAHRSASKGVLSRLGLTPRESDVAAWISAGKSNVEIAAILLKSPRTVEKHVEKILGKLGVENRTAAALVVLGTSGGAFAASRDGASVDSQQALRNLFGLPAAKPRASLRARPRP